MPGYVDVVICMSILSLWSSIGYHLPILANSSAIIPILWRLLYVVLIIGALCVVLWLVEAYISKIPPPARIFLAIIVLILAVIYLMTGFGLG